MASKVLAAICLFSSMFIAGAKAQAPVYKSATSAYNAEVNASVSLLYDATVPASEPAVRKRPIPTPNNFNQATLSAALAQKSSRSHVSHPTPPMRASFLASGRTQPFASLSTNVGPHASSSPFQAATHKALADPTFSKPGSSRLQPANHGFNSHQPVAVDHGFITPHAKELAKKSSCCEAPR